MQLQTLVKQKGIPHWAGSTKFSKTRKQRNRHVPCSSSLSNSQRTKGAGHMHILIFPLCVLIISKMNDFHNLFRLTDSYWKAYLFSNVRHITPATISSLRATPMSMKYVWYIETVFQNIPKSLCFMLTPRQCLPFAKKVRNRSINDKSN